MSDKTPLPAAELLRLADDLLDYVDGGAFDVRCMDLDYIERGNAAREAYRAARARCKWTLEEHLLTDLYRQDFDYALDDSKDEKWVAACRALHDHARALAEKGGA